ncbi:hypothetical protein FA09DRAFT_10803 [Tilletiopsis washingtonensis]|uniref:Uncharacterized protein n=1 Tax=Tilletiopsis washingtonensis TaxID=58919 RepID=A0A316ZK01_9BASI|nr:hypothetical protein FA09DRAFT_10803 [Tilletiopsis washingtonensis]PWO01333.1 hypothetical protein FA09DRAFT_10803 [Tilletiopsis washingtonensis]
MPFFGGGSSSPPKSGGNAMGRSGSNQGSAMGRTSSNQGRSGGQVGQTPGSSTGSASYFGNNVADDDERSDVPSTVATSVHTGGYDSGNKVGFGVSSQVDNSSKGGQQQGSYGQNNSSTPTPGAYGGQQQSGGQQSGNTGGQQRGQQQTHQQQHQQQQQSGGYVSQQQSGYGNNSLGGQQSYSDAANNSGGNRRDTIASTYEDARENSTMDNQSIMGRGREQSLVEQSGDWSVDQSRMAAGHGNVSRWEQTDAASFLGSDPIAQATDFQDGDIIFVSSEAGAAATRQPPTRFRVSSSRVDRA